MRHKVLVLLIFGLIIHLSKGAITTMMPSPSPMPSQSPTQSPSPFPSPSSPTTASPSPSTQSAPPPTTTAASESPPPPPPSTPPIFDVEKEMQKVTDFTDGLEILFEIYNSSESKTESFEIIGKNFKKYMEASRKCGIILHDGLHIDELEQYFKDNNGTNEGITKLKDIAFDLDFEVGYFRSKSTSDFYNIQSLRYSSLLESEIKSPFEISCFYFELLLEAIHGYKKSFDKFKNNCELKIMNEGYFVEYLENKIHLEYDMNRTDYTDNFFIKMRKSYRKIIEHSLATYPMCNIFNNGLPNPQNAYKQAQEFIVTIQRIIKRFEELRTIQNEKYWSNKNILKIVKKFILGDITVAEPYTDDNDKIAKDIYNYLSENYRSLGYTYHVGVSNSGTNGNVDTLIQCSTECKFIYGINNKDVYIIRNKQVPTYKECKFLTPNSNNPFDCSTTRDSTDLTELAEEIQSKCNPTAFSLVRKRLKYASEGGTGDSYYIGLQRITEPPAFSQKCFGDIYVVMAKNF